MVIETGALITVGIFTAGLCVATGRVLERQTVMRRDLQKLEALVTREIGELKQVLYTTIGGRRTIRPIGVADEPIDGPT